MCTFIGKVANRCVRKILDLRRHRAFVTLPLRETAAPLATILTMATNRLALLKQMVEQNPKNSFARYGLAMEHANNGQLEDAMAEFKALLAIDETYAAAYYHGGQVLEKLGRIEEAREIYERGIDACNRKGDMHTRSEIEAALSLLPI